jgi:predicted AAA+ superfamily ATPase
VSWYLLDALASAPVWSALDAGAHAPRAHADAWRASQRAGGDPADALADAALYGDGTWAVVAAAQPAAVARPEVAAALACDVERVVAVLRAATPPPGAPAWPAAQGEPDDPVRFGLAAHLRAGRVDAAVAALVAHARRRGAGPLARHAALAWDGGAWHAAPERPVDPLHGVEEQVARLDANVRAFLDGRPAHATLLYGPRGSGKSTAVRALLARHADQGLRLAEVRDPGRLGEALEALRPWPFPTLLVLDDLAFEEGETGYRPLKSLLEGGVRGLPERCLVVATSNRRHLVRERLRDRPDPLDDDVHAWDTHQERLALAHRFGLVLTFPALDRRRYLELVGALATAEGLPTPAEGWATLAVPFAERGSGYSGRTARQFVTEERQRRAALG